MTQIVFSLSSSSPPPPPPSSCASASSYLSLLSAEMLWKPAKPVIVVRIPLSVILGSIRLRIDLERDGKLLSGQRLDYLPIIPRVSASIFAAYLISEFRTMRSIISVYSIEFQQTWNSSAIFFLGQTLRLRYFTPKMVILCQPASQQHYRAIIIIKRTLISSSAIPFHHLPNDRLLIEILSYSSNYNWVHFFKSLLKTQHFTSSSCRRGTWRWCWCGVVLCWWWLWK